MSGTPATVINGFGTSPRAVANLEPLPAARMTVWVTRNTCCTGAHLNTCGHSYVRVTFGRSSSLGRTGAPPETPGADPHGEFNRRSLRARHHRNPQAPQSPSDRTRTRQGA